MAKTRSDAWRYPRLRATATTVATIDGAPTPVITAVWRSGEFTTRTLLCTVTVRHNDGHTATGTAEAREGRTHCQRTASLCLALVDAGLAGKIGELTGWIHQGPAGILGELGRLMGHSAVTTIYQE